MKKGMMGRRDFHDGEEEDIKSLCALLNRENKQRVIAEAKAILSLQKKSEGQIARR